MVLPWRVGKTLGTGDGNGFGICLDALLDANTGDRRGMHANIAPYVGS